jgi:hypothetical protein
MAQARTTRSGAAVNMLRVRVPYLSSGVPRRLRPNSARMVTPVLLPQLPYASVVALRELRPPRLTHAGDDCDCRLAKSAPQQLLVFGVLEQAEEPELFAARTGETDLVPAGHRAVHRLPLPAPGELRWRRRGDRIKHRCELGVDLARTRVQELERRDRFIGCPVMNDRPGRRSIDAGRLAGLAG